jgi:hypothetical protein
LNVAKISGGADAEFNNCIINDAEMFREVFDSKIELNNCISLNNDFSLNNIIAINCTLLNIKTSTNNHNLEFIESRLEFDGRFLITSGTSIFERCLIDLNKNTQTVAMDVDGGNLSILYCVLKNNTSTNFYVGQSNDVNSNLVFDNNTLIGNNNNSRGLINFKTGGALEINNNIFVDNSVALLGSQQINANNCLFFNNNTTTQQNVTLIDEVIADPLFVNEANDNYKLGTGSPAIGAGLTATETLGIDTANWGDGTTETPVITTKEQGVNWDIGAYVS